MGKQKSFRMWRIQSWLWHVLPNRIKRIRRALAAPVTPSFQIDSMEPRLYLSGEAPGAADDPWMVDNVVRYEVYAGERLSVTDVDDSPFKNDGWFAPEIRDDFTVSVLREPEHDDYFFFNSSTGLFTYEAELGFDGKDSFIYKITNNQTAVAAFATVTISVVDITPTVVPEIYLSVGAGEELEITLDDLKAMAHWERTEPQLDFDPVGISNLRSVQPTKGVTSDAKPAIYYQASTEPTEAGEYDAFTINVFDAAAPDSIATVTAKIQVGHVGTAPVADNDYFVYDHETYDNPGHKLYGNLRWYRGDFDSFGSDAFLHAYQLAADTLLYVDRDITGFGRSFGDYDPDWNTWFNRDLVTSVVGNLAGQETPLQGLIIEHLINVAPELALQYDMVSGHGPSHAEHFELHDDGRFSYKPVPGFSGIDSFVYTVTDTDGNESKHATVTIEVYPGGWSVTPVYEALYYGYEDHVIYNSQAYRDDVGSSEEYSVGTLLQRIFEFKFHSNPAEGYEVFATPVTPNSDLQYGTISTNQDGDFIYTRNPDSLEIDGVTETIEWEATSHGLTQRFTQKLLLRYSTRDIDQSGETILTSATPEILATHQVHDVYDWSEALLSFSSSQEDRILNGLPESNKHSLLGNRQVLGDPFRPHRLQNPTLTLYSSDPRVVPSFDYVANQLYIELAEGLTEDDFPVGTVLITALEERLLDREPDTDSTEHFYEYFPVWFAKRPAAPRDIEPVTVPISSAGQEVLLNDLNATHSYQAQYTPSTQEAPIYILPVASPGSTLEIETDDQANTWYILNHGKVRLNNTNDASRSFLYVPNGLTTGIDRLDYRLVDDFDNPSPWALAGPLGSINFHVTLDNPREGGAKPYQTHHMQVLKTSWEQGLLEGVVDGQQIVADTREDSTGAVFGEGASTGDAANLSLDRFKAPEISEDSEPNYIGKFMDNAGGFVYVPQNYQDDEGNTTSWTGTDYFTFGVLRGDEYVHLVNNESAPWTPAGALGWDKNPAAWSQSGLARIDVINEEPEAYTKHFTVIHDQTATYLSTSNTENQLLALGPSVTRHDMTSDGDQHLDHDYYTVSLHFDDEATADEDNFFATSGGNGRIRLSSDGSYQYRPNAGFIGTDYFYYRLNDTADDSNIGIAVIDVTNEVVTGVDLTDQTENILRSGGVHYVSAEQGVIARKGQATDEPASNRTDADGDLLKVYQLKTGDNPTGPITQANASEWLESEGNGVDLEFGKATLLESGAWTFEFDPSKVTEATVFPLKSEIRFVYFDGVEYSQIFEQPIEIYDLVDRPGTFQYEVAHGSTLVVNTFEGLLSKGVIEDGTRPAEIYGLQIANTSDPGENDWVDVDNNDPLNVLPGGALIYEAPTMPGTVQYRFLINDDHALSRQRVAGTNDQWEPSYGYIEINIVNTAPAAVSRSYETTVDRQLIVSRWDGLMPSGADTDEDGDLVTVRLAYIADDAQGDPDYTTLQYINPTGEAYELNYGRITWLNEKTGAFIYEPNEGLSFDGSIAEELYVVFSEGSELDDDSSANNYAQLKARSARLTISIRDTQTPPTAPDQSYNVHFSDTLYVPFWDGLLSDSTDSENDQLFVASVAGHALPLASDGANAQVTFTVTNSGGAALGVLTVTAGGSLRFVPAAYAGGAEEEHIDLEFVVIDGTDIEEEASNLRITLTNQFPEGNDDFYQVSQDGLLAVTYRDGLLSNDTDPDGDSLTIVSISQPSLGDFVRYDPVAEAFVPIDPNELLVDAQPGSFLYRPSAGKSGTETLYYTLSDGGITLLGPIEVTIEILADAPPVLTEDTYEVLRPKSGRSFSSGRHEWSTGLTDLALLRRSILTVPAWDGVLRNDHNPSGDRLYVELAEDPQTPGTQVVNGTVQLSSDGSFTFDPDALTPADEQGAFWYRVSAVHPDVALPSDWSEPVKVSIDLIDTAPVAQPTTYFFSESYPTFFSARQGLLVNDFDAEGDPLTVRLLQGPSEGELILNPDGSFLFLIENPTQDAYQFQYEVADDGAFDDGDNATAWVELKAATLLANSLNTSEIVIENDDGTVTTINLLEELNGQAPWAEFDTHMIWSSLAMMRPELNTGPLHGELIILPDGTTIYHPYETAATEDSAIYHLVNESSTIGHLSGSIVFQRVNAVPVASDDTYSVHPLDTLEISSLEGVLNNDVDDDSLLLTATTVGDGPQYGQVTLHPGGGFQYIPDLQLLLAATDGLPTQDTFTYQVTDGVSTSDPVTVTILFENAAPAQIDSTLSPDLTYSVAPNQYLTIDPDQGLLSQFEDADGDTLSVVFETYPSIGSLISHDETNDLLDQIGNGFSPTDFTTDLLPGLISSGAFTYHALGLQHNMQTTFSYYITDGIARTDTITVTLEAPANNLPDIPENRHYYVQHDQVLHVNSDDGLRPDMFDADGDRLEIGVNTTGLIGDLTIMPNGSMVYLPEPNRIYETTFNYRLVDGYAATSMKPVTIHVTNAQPGLAQPYQDISSFTYNLTHDRSIFVEPAQGLRKYFEDYEGDTLQFRVRPGQGDIPGMLQLDQTGAFVYTPLAGSLADVDVLIDVSDGIIDADGNLVWYQRDEPLRLNIQNNLTIPDTRTFTLNASTRETLVLSHTDLRAIASQTWHQSSGDNPIAPLIDLFDDEGDALTIRLAPADAALENRYPQFNDRVKLYDRGGLVYQQPASPENDSPERFRVIVTDGVDEVTFEIKIEFEHDHAPSFSFNSGPPNVNVTSDDHEPVTFFHHETFDANDRRHFDRTKFKASVDLSYTPAGTTLANLVDGQLLLASDQPTDLDAGYKKYLAKGGTLYWSTSGSFHFEPLPSFTGTQTIPVLLADDFDEGQRQYFIKINVTNKPVTTQNLTVQLPEEITSWDQLPSVDLFAFMLDPDDPTAEMDVMSVETTGIEGSHPEFTPIYNQGKISLVFSGSGDPPDLSTPLALTPMSDPLVFKFKISDGHTDSGDLVEYSVTFLPPAEAHIVAETNGKIDLLAAQLRAAKSRLAADAAEALALARQSFIDRIKFDTTSIRETRAGLLAEVQAGFAVAQEYIQADNDHAITRQQASFDAAQSIREGLYEQWSDVVDAAVAYRETLAPTLAAQLLAERAAYIAYENRMDNAQRSYAGDFATESQRLRNDLQKQTLVAQLSEAYALTQFNQQAETLADTTRSSISSAVLTRDQALRAQLEQAADEQNTLVSALFDDLQLAVDAYNDDLAALEVMTYSQVDTDFQGILTDLSSGWNTYNNDFQLGDPDEYGTEAPISWTASEKQAFVDIFNTYSTLTEAARTRLTAARETAWSDFALALDTTRLAAVGESADPLDDFTHTSDAIWLTYQQAVTEAENSFDAQLGDAFTRLHDDVSHAYARDEPAIHGKVGYNTRLNTLRDNFATNYWSAFVQFDQNTLAERTLFDNDLANLLTDYDLLLGSSLKTYEAALGDASQPATPEGIRFTAMHAAATEQNDEAKSIITELDAQAVLSSQAQFTAENAARNSFHGSEGAPAFKKAWLDAEQAMFNLLVSRDTNDRAALATQQVNSMERAALYAAEALTRRDDLLEAEHLVTYEQAGRLLQHQRTLLVSMREHAEGAISETNLNLAKKHAKVMELDASEQLQLGLLSARQSYAENLHAYKADQDVTADAVFLTFAQSNATRQQAYFNAIAAEQQALGHARVALDLTMKHALVDAAAARQSQDMDRAAILQAGFAVAAATRQQSASAAQSAFNATEITLDTERKLRDQTAYQAWLDDTGNRTSDYAQTQADLRAIWALNTAALEATLAHDLQAAQTDLARELAIADALWLTRAGGASEQLTADLAIAELDHQSLQHSAQTEWVDQLGQHWLTFTAANVDAAAAESAFDETKVTTYDPAAASPPELTELEAWAVAQLDLTDAADLALDRWLATQPDHTGAIWAHAFESACIDIARLKILPFSNLIAASDALASDATLDTTPLPSGLPFFEHFTQLQIGGASAGIQSLQSLYDTSLIDLPQDPQSSDPPPTNLATTWHDYFTSLTSSSIDYLGQITVPEPLDPDFVTPPELLFATDEPDLITNTITGLQGSSTAYRLALSNTLWQQIDDSSASLWHYEQTLAASEQFLASDTRIALQGNGTSIPGLAADLAAAADDVLQVETLADETLKQAVNTAGNNFAVALTASMAEESLALAFAEFRLTEKLIGNSEGVAQAEFDQAFADLLAIAPEGVGLFFAHLVNAVADAGPQHWVEAEKDRLTRLAGKDDLIVDAQFALEEALAIGRHDYAVMLAKHAVGIVPDNAAGLIAQLPALRAAQATQATQYLSLLFNSRRGSIAAQYEAARTELIAMDASQFASVQLAQLGGRSWVQYFANTFNYLGNATIQFLADPQAAGEYIADAGKEFIIGALEGIFGDPARWAIERAFGSYDELGIDTHSLWYYSGYATGFVASIVVPFTKVFQAANLLGKTLRLVSAAETASFLVESGYYGYDYLTNPNSQVSPLQFALQALGAGIVGTKLSLHALGGAGKLLTATNQVTAGIKTLTGAGLSKAISISKKTGSLVNNAITLSHWFGVQTAYLTNAAIFGVMTGMAKVADDIAQWTTGKTGEVAEELVTNWLRGRGYDIIDTIKNTSNHGIDLIVRNRHGSLRFVEIKGTRTGLMGRLSKAQKNMVEFVTKRLGLASGRVFNNRWIKIDPATKQVAGELLDEITKSNRDPRGFVVNVLWTGGTDFIYLVRPWR